MKEITPQKAANQISKILAISFGEKRFPISVKEWAVQYSKDICPNKNNCQNFKNKDCIIKICGIPLSENTDGCLKKTENGWVIIYNDAIKYPGRINFTIAHEFGHYILHRKKYPHGLNCDKNDISRDDNVKSVEREANIFASYLLMPFDDFRETSRKYPFSIELFRALADRYKASLTATVLKWIEMTDKMAMAVFSDNGFIEWKKQSTPLLKKKIFSYKTESPEELPSTSLSARIDNNISEDHEKNQKNIWCKNSFSEEIVFNAPHLESKIIIVLFKYFEASLEEEKEEDCFDKISKFV